MTSTNMKAHSIYRSIFTLTEVDVAHGGLMTRKRPVPIENCHETVKLDAPLGAPGTSEVTHKLETGDSKPLCELSGSNGLSVGA